jgi:hypothetical protein
VLEKEARRGWVEQHVVLTADAVTIRAPGSARALDTVRGAAPETRPCISARKREIEGERAVLLTLRCVLAGAPLRHAPRGHRKQARPDFCGQPLRAHKGAPPAPDFHQEPLTPARSPMGAIHTGARVRRQDETVSFHAGRRRREDTPAAAPSDSNTVFTVCAPRLARPMLSAAYASGAARLSAAGGPGAGGRWPTR